MLVPAIAYKDELLKKFSKEIYSERYYWYMGYGHGHTLPNIGDSDNNYQWAVLSNDKLVGYFAYKITPELDCVDNFGLYSFDDPDSSIMRNALSLGKDVYNKLEELVNNHHRVSWIVIAGNPVVKSYDKFCELHNGTKVCLHDVSKDVQGNYYDEYIYEIIKNKNKDEELDWRVV